MEIKLLNEEYLKSSEIYEDFIKDQIQKNENAFSSRSVYMEEAPFFPIYLRVNNELREDLYLEAFRAISKYYLKTSREVHFDEVFWHSILCTTFRSQVIETYPEVLESEKDFRNIVLKKFDWENYIYKCVIGAQYIWDNVESEEERKDYVHRIVNNLDVYNYIIKYEIFRNDSFLINVLDIIKDHDLSEVLKKKITWRDDLGKDERVGRRVIFELNKSYPVILAPMLNKEELEVLFLKHMNEYLEGEENVNVNTFV